MLILIVPLLSLSCAKKHAEDPIAFRVVSVEVLTGSQSHVSDADTYLIVVKGPRSTIHAEGYDYVRTGETLCEAMPGLLFGKYDSAKPCGPNSPSDTATNVTSNINFGQPVGAPSLGSKMFHITREDENR
jgi:hypothetical protein